MPITTPPKDQANWLVRNYGSPELALEHATWAFGMVEKPDTKMFWEKTIDELKKMEFPLLAND